MGIEQCQRVINSLNKEIAALEKKKATEDRKIADNRKKAAGVKISKNTSPTMLKSKMRQIDGYEAAARRAEKASAEQSAKIAEKRLRLNEANLKLQKEEQKEQKKQEKSIERMKQVYEKRISDLELIRQKAFDDELNGKMFDTATEYDVFISHAWEDKEDFVEDFVLALTEKGISVWYDKNEIKWGDSMRERIDAGLRMSKFGVIILSPHYIAEGKYWTKAELDGLFQLESINGKTLLPIWHNLTKKQVMEYSPTIASKLAMTTAFMTAEELADELVNIILQS